MTDKKAKEEGYTYRAKMYGFIGYACPDDETHDTFRAKYWLTDRIVECLIYFETVIPINECYVLVLIDKL